MTVEPRGGVVATFQPSSDRKRPWLVYADGVRLSSASGVGRRFATREAAEEAGRRAITKSSIK